MLEKNIYRKLLSHAFDIPVSVTYWDNKVEVYGVGEPVIKVRLKRKLPLQELTDQPTLVLGEAYMDGDIQIEGSIQELIASAYRKSESFLTKNSFLKYLPKMSHSERASQRDIKSHYDIGNDFYRLWLDETMTYSCAYYKSDDDSLKEAQLNKDRYIL